MSEQAAFIDESLEKILRAAGSSLRHYMPASRDDLRRAMQEIIAAARPDTAEARLREALEFYADGRRYEGPNQRPIPGDKFAKPDAAYIHDVSRDCGQIARKALSPPSGGDEVTNISVSKEMALQMTSLPGDKAKESDKTGMRVEDKPRSHGESLQYGPDTSSSPSTAAMSHGKGPDAASVAIPVASSDLLVSQEAPVLSDPPADRREIVARLLATAKLLFQNAVGCATNHYGHDHELNGLPGWLADCERDIRAASAALAQSEEKK